MAGELITSFDKWIPSTLKYGNVKLNKNGGKNIKILDSKNGTLIINTPLILTWGINKNIDVNSQRASYNLALQYPSEQYGTETTNLFFKKMKEFEETILKDAQLNSEVWFNKKKMSREVVDALYSPILKYPKDKETKEPDHSRMPTTRVKIPYWDEKFNVELYNTKNEALFTPGDVIEENQFETLIPKTSHIAVVMQCNGIWFINGKFGVSFQMLQAIVQPPVRIQGSCFVQLLDKDKDILKTLQSTETNSFNDVKVEESDDDEKQYNEDQHEDQHEEEIVPIVKKKGKKKTVIKD
jgi:hypothetical protein